MLIRAAWANSQGVSKRTGYRQYTEDFVERVRFIRRAKELGFTLDEVIGLPSLRVDPETDSGEVKQRSAAKVADIDQKISDLERMKHQLTRLVASCSGSGPTSECPILEAIEGEDSSRILAD